MHLIGTMQGRLLPMVDGRIQAFPRGEWEREFELAADVGYDSIELTIEMASYDIHPVRSDSGRRRINQLSRAHGVQLAGLCCDVFMERPLTDVDVGARTASSDILADLIRACGELDLPMIEIPTMGDNSLKDPAARDRARRGRRRDFGIGPASGRFGVLHGRCRSPSSGHQLRYRKQHLVRLRA